MTEVFFYHGAADRIAAACALLGGAAAQKKPVLVYAPEAGLATMLDRSLWTHNALSFVPHCAADSPLAAETPIQIAASAAALAAAGPRERLMNLGHQAVPNFERYARLIEVVGQEEEERQIARERVQFYRQSGCDVRFFDLSQR
ncbi:MAG: DNA polymerase III subunit chi [Azonexus sp.]|nr:DNA polymerase III subunit chi [Azonexus sp.]MCK6411876.1 DNA polymerase III subunit chi [Azonexus sp.]